MGLYSVQDIHQQDQELLQANQQKPIPPDQSGSSADKYCSSLTFSSQSTGEPSWAS